MAIWKPQAVPINVRDAVLSRYLRQMLNSLAAHLNYGGREYIWFEKISLRADVPDKPQEGMLIYLDDDVLPGEPKGFVYWDGVSWVRL
jgi:hypothetical protein